MGANGSPCSDGHDIIIVKDATEVPLLETVFYNFLKIKNVWRVPDTWYTLMRSP